MKWGRIKRAEIDAEIRREFEERGVETAKLYIALPGWTMRKGD